MIERQNIIKLLDDRVNVYHSALLTSYNFDPIFFESVYLSTLRRLGITNIVVLIDSGMYDTMLSDSSYSSHQVNMCNYTLVRQENQYGGVFHPKITLLFGVDEGALIVGSGNITFSGLSNNEEVWNAFHVDGDDSPNYALLHKAWSYIGMLTKNASPLVKRQLQWIEEQSDWINKPSDEEPVTLVSGETATLLFNSTNDTILEGLKDAIGDVSVDEITVLAPFYDTKGDAIKGLKKMFNPKEFHCVLDLDRQSAPYALLKGNSDIDFYKYTERSNPLHAKIFEFHTDKGTWLLSGSANAGNMALGMSKHNFNDEACILVHSNKRKKYLYKLGVEDKFIPISEDEKNDIVPPTPKRNIPSSKNVTITSCELKEEELFLNFTKEGIGGTLIVLSNEQEELFREDITSKTSMSIYINDIELEYVHLVVLRMNEEDISNKCLVIKEINVESCNPDPKHRRLSSLLDDNGLMENINHILGFIEFDEDNKPKSKGIGSSTRKPKDEDDSNIVTRDQFDELKDNSVLNISMHSGVRILSYLQKILFKADKEGQSEDELFDLQTENEVEDAKQANRAQEQKEASESDVGIKLRNEIGSYLNRMTQFLLEKMEDQSIQEEGIKSLPLDARIDLPKLKAIPELNSSSSIAVATTAVAYLMQNYRTSIPKIAELRKNLFECSCLFFALYGQNFPTDTNTNRNRKIREILIDATVMLYVSLCYFDFRRNDYQLILTLLNSFDAWRNEKETLSLITESFKKKIAELDNILINVKTYDTINEMAVMYISNDVPINAFSSSQDEVYFYKTGYGFFMAYDIIKCSDGWKYTYYHPRHAYDVTIHNASKYKGYYFNSLRL